jgi:hypothetical protein
VRVPNGSSSLFRGLDTPAATYAFDLGNTMDVDPPAKVVRKCAAYASHAVLWTENPALVGDQDVAVRTRPAGWPPERTCVAAAEEAHERSLSNRDTYSPVGIVGRYLFAVEDDPHGALTRFQVVDMDTGRHLIDDTLHHEKGFDVVRDRAGVTVSWWSSVGQLLCLPRRGESACWRRVLMARKVPAAVTIPQPDCEAIAKRRPSYAADPAGIQVTVHVRFGLGRSDLEYLGDAATCDEAP